MNKQLERDLLCSIQSLKSTQLNNVLGQFQKLTNTATEKNIIKKGISYGFECQLTWKNESTKGYGRNEEEALSNATKGLLSVLVGKNIQVSKITMSLKYKNGIENALKGPEREARNPVKQNDCSLILDDISMIQPNPRMEFSENKKNDNCDCVYFDKHQYQQNEIKHLQARVSLLTEENMLLKKMLLCGSNSNYKQVDGEEKENNSYRANASFNDSKCKI